MCGRTAQTVDAVRLSASSLGVALHMGGPGPSESGIEHGDSSSHVDNTNNYNLSPGMDAWVFHKGTTKDEKSQLSASRKIWGLVPRSGTSANPLPAHDMGRHFSNLMFNARSDDGHLQPTFSRLAAAGKSCVVAVDGFFEWKTELGVKQPYFVQSSTSTPTLLAGLWTSVATGRQEEEDQPYLDTFTLLTTAASPSLQWLHSRMPVQLTSMEAAVAWMERQELPPQSDAWKWHAVTPAMSSLKFRSAKAIKPLPTMKTVKSMFRAVAEKKPSKPVNDDVEVHDKKKVTHPKVTTKRAAPASTSTSSTPQKKKPKPPPAGTKTIDAFFRPKKVA